jgi:hypothetical protein
MESLRPCPQSKSRIAKRNLTIPRLQLVSGHMAGNLVTNVDTAIGNEKVTSVHCWLDSTVVLDQRSRGLIHYNFLLTLNTDMRIT